MGKIENIDKVLRKIFEILHYSDTPIKELIERNQELLGMLDANPSKKIIDEANFEEFTLKMKRMLEKKKEEYKDTWKTCDLDILLAKIEEQTKKLHSIKGRNHALKILTHIANYSYFIYTRLSGNEMG